MRSRLIARTAPGVAAAAVLVMALAIVPATAADGLSVRISPERALVVPGGEAGFSAAVLDSDGEEVPADIVWSVIPPRAGVVDGSGRFVAGDATGTAIIRAMAVYEGASGVGHAAAIIGDEPAAGLTVSIEPPSVALSPGEDVQFMAEVTAPESGEQVPAELRWVVLPGAVGSITQDGLLTAGSSEISGRVAARAITGGREGVGDATVVVGSPPGAGVRVSVTPPSALVEPGEEFGFSAIVLDESENPLDADVSWLVMPARLGVVAADGTFTAGPDEGAGRVVATIATTEGPSRGFARIEVRRSGPAGLKVRVRPREAAVLTGGDVQFDADVIGPDGETLDIPVDWSVRPEWLGTIDQSGLFTASEEMPEPSSNGGWLGTVVASIETNAGPASDAARVIVRDGGPALRLRILPHNPLVTPGQDIQFETRVIGAEAPNDWTTEWAVFPEDLGTITPDGLFTANPVLGDPSSGDFGPRDGYVGARATFADGSTLTDRSHVRVRIPGHPVQVRVRPAFVIVPPGESTEFEAVVLGPNGEETSLPVTWNVAPAHVGNMSPDGVFTAADLNIEPGSWQRPRGMIVAEVRVGNGRVFRGTAIVVVDLPDPEVFVRVSPKSATIAEGETFQFTAEAFAANGDPIDLELQWRVSDELVGHIEADGLFTAASSLPQGHSRRATVLAGGTYEGRVYWDYATVRVSQGP